MEDQASNLRRLVEDMDVSGSDSTSAYGVENETIENVVQDNSSAMAKVIAVTSGKGGVGKTNISLNLAIALAETGKRVLLIDADVGMANVDVLIGERPRYTMHDFMREDIDPKDVLQHGPSGIRYISGGSGLEHLQDFEHTSRARLAQKLTACGEGADYIIVDTGAGISDSVMDFVLFADEVLLVTTPEPTSITDAYAMIKAYSMYAENKNLQVIVNRVYDDSESRDVLNKLKHTAGRFLGIDVGCLGWVYEDSHIRKAVRMQKPLLIAFPDTSSAKCIRSIAVSVDTGHPGEITVGWRTFLRKLFHFAAHTGS